METRLREELRESRRQIKALVADVAASHRERQALEHLLRTSDFERQMIAYEIHDGLVQDLAAALMHLQALEHLKDFHPDKAGQEYQTAVAKLQACHAEARHLINGLRPEVLEEMGIVAAIESLVQEANCGGGPNAEFYPQFDGQRFPPLLENALYRIVQESLNNARRHSQSDRVRIEFFQLGNLVRLIVQDWGIGFNSSKVKKGRLGLEGIQERARMLGGKATIESDVSCGTRIVVEVPLSRCKALERENEGA